MLVQQPYLWQFEWRIPCSGRKLARELSPGLLANGKCNYSKSLVTISLEGSESLSLLNLKLEK